MSVLSGKNLERLREFLAEPACNYDPDRGTNPDPYSKILAWARDPEHGGLPERSARAFAEWLSNVWAEWTDPEGVTVKEVLEGAVEAWCGGRTF